ncbi:MAG: bifunctional folylpolyglutamate synthase/dihydrofolate synthase [Candidatus Gastranaerophilales bacterium]|nr:bifunctional folylpolyglutamate synthase/dihydrofolate synthase [Candidatus Gastranaerophilales bacterium]
MISYEKSVEILTSQGKFYISLGLERVQKILSLFGNPQDNLKVIHVAGTNGKGSTSAMLSAILTQAGFKTALYTSPHLFEYTERIKISGVDISKDKFAFYVNEICMLADANDVHLTEFEILTVMAFLYFNENNVDIAVIETGLGGRFDATNVIKENICSIITSISIDHKDRLGDTIEKIAFEKAGIIKKGCPVVISPENNGFDVVSNVASVNSAELIKAHNSVELMFDGKINYAVIDGQKHQFGMLGLYQKDNLELVLSTISLLKCKKYAINDEDLFAALQYVTWPARLQYIPSRAIIVDGAHNFDGALRLRESLDYYFPKKNRVWIYGSLNTKEYDKVVKTLFRKEDTVFFYKFKNKNAITINDIKLNISAKLSEIKLPEAENILNNFSHDSVTIVSGSLYMIGELLKNKKF